jgi:hypothetical protein
MSLRDFNTPASDDPIALHNEPSGNGSGLSNFHTVSVEEREPNNTPKIVGAVAVALLVGVAAVGLYANSGSSHKPIVAANTTKTAPIAPPPQQMAMAPDSGGMSNTAPVPSAVPPAPGPQPAATIQSSRPAAVRTASSRSARLSSSATSEARMSAGSSQATQAPLPAQVTPAPEQAQATPLPAAPAPSPSDVASNSPAVPNNAGTAADIPQASTAPQQLQSSTPQASNAAPAQDQQSGATPAPAQ